MPCLRQCSRSPVSAFAVRAMMGVRPLAGRGFELADQSGCSEPVHHRHFAVHQNRIEPALPIEVYRFVAIRGVNRHHSHASRASAAEMKAFTALSSTSSTVLPRAAARPTAAQG